MTPGELVALIRYHMSEADRLITPDAPTGALETALKHIAAAQERLKELGKR